MSGGILGADRGLEWHRAVAPGVEVGEITTQGRALSRPRRGFESRWGHHIFFLRLSAKAGSSTVPAPPDGDSCPRNRAWPRVPPYAAALSGARPTPRRAGGRFIAVGDPEGMDQFVEHDVGRDGPS